MADTPEKSGLSPDKQIPSLKNNSAIGLGASVVKPNTKKYDLGVLFVHGIGDQKPGETLKSMYEPIKENFESNQNFYFKEVACNKTGSRTAVISNNVSTKNVIFRESYWHGKTGEKAPQVFPGFLTVLLLKFLQFRVSSICFVLFVSFLFLIYTQGIIDKINPNYDPQIPVLSILLTVLILFTIFLVACIYFPKVKNLHRQVKENSRGYESEYRQKVLQDIIDISRESQDTLVVAHSMGGYLAYNSFFGKNSSDSEVDKNISLRSINFVGIGSGLGPMTILEKNRYNNLPCLYGVLTIFIIARFIAWYNIWIGLYGFLHGLKWENISPINGFANLGYEWSLFISFCILVLMRLGVYCIYRMYKIEENKFSTQGLSKHYELYYSTDFVGNSSRFTYLKDVYQKRLYSIPDARLEKEGKGSALKEISLIIKGAIFPHAIVHYMNNKYFLDLLTCLIMSPFRNPLDKIKSTGYMWFIYFIFTIGASVSFWHFQNSPNSPSSLSIIILFLPLILIFEYVFYIIQSIYCSYLFGGNSRLDRYASWIIRLFFMVPAPALVCCLSLEIIGVWHYIPLAILIIVLVLLVPIISFPFLKKYKERKASVDSI